ncbi:MAG: MBL fold metallo-hydrolase [Bacteroidota bacterium]|nr:MBL fold metallo-hydrolase [Candidatus Kapabacteria bacterium]MDW8220908.1 MBL fold metallo-hydrolase [Bacteroidota bacterium]
MNKIFPIEAGPAATFGYMVTDAEQGVAAVIDTPLGSTDYFLSHAQQENVRIVHIILTHSHWDHTGDAAQLQRATQAKIAIHPDDEYRILNPNAHTSFPLPFQLEACKADMYLHAGDTLAVGSWLFEIRHTPGHTEGGICLIDHKRKLAFVGDTLFAGSIGRTDLPGGDTAALLHSIRTQLLTLDDDTVVLPGHGSRTTIGTERRSNPFLLY